MLHGHSSHVCTVRCLSKHFIFPALPSHLTVCVWYTHMCSTVKLLTQAKLRGYNNITKRTPSTVYLKGKLSRTRPCRHAIVCRHSMPCGIPQLLPGYIQGLVRSSLRATRVICPADVTSVRCISTGNCCGDSPWRSGNFSDEGVLLVVWTLCSGVVRQRTSIT